VKVESLRFGTLEISEDRILTFPESFPGFIGRRYVLIPDKEVSIAEWLQSIDEPEVALLVVDPTAILPTYAGQPKPAEIRAIKPDDRPNDKIACRVIVRAGERSNELLLNLFAPIFLNVERKLAMQVPLVGSGHSVRQIWPPRPDGEEEPPAEA
jgi:flagellar assembly factor FliW